MMIPGNLYFFHENKRIFTLVSRYQSNPLFKPLAIYFKIWLSNIIFAPFFFNVRLSVRCLELRFYEHNHDLINIWRVIFLIMSKLSYNILSMIPYTREYRVQLFLIWRGSHRLFTTSGQFLQFMSKKWLFFSNDSFFVFRLIIINFFSEYF